MDVFLTIWKTSSENTDKSRIVTFICSQMNVSLNFALEICMACDISIRKFSIVFYFDILTRGAREKILKVEILHYCI